MWSKWWMKSLAALLAAVVVAIVAIALIPLQTIVSRLPPNVQLVNPEGTLWSGHAEQLSVNGLGLGAVQWSLDPLPLLWAEPTVSLTVHSAIGAIEVVVVVVDDHTLDLNRIRTNSTLNPATLPLPLSGTVALDVDHLRLVDGAVTELNGSARLSQLGVGQPATPLGDYVFTMNTQHDTAVIRVSSDHAEHPAQLELVLTATRHYVLTGVLGATPTGSVPAWLQALVQPDGQGRWRLSVSGQY